jgi:hypothetical protein
VVRPAAGAADALDQRSEVKADEAVERGMRNHAQELRSPIERAKRQAKQAEARRSERRARSEKSNFYRVLSGTILSKAFLSKTQGDLWI